MYYHDYPTPLCHQIIGPDKQQDHYALPKSAHKLPSQYSTLSMYDHDYPTLLCHQIIGPDKQPNYHALPKSAHTLQSQYSTLSMYYPHYPTLSVSRVCVCVSVSVCLWGGWVGYTVVHHLLLTNTYFS